MKIKIYPLLMMIVMTLVSCNHKDLCYMAAQQTKIIVEYDWREAPDASPAGMCVFFYSVDAPGVYYRYDFDNIKGGEIEIPVGRYVLITYNNDTEAVRFSGINRSDIHSARTREGDLLEPLYGNGITSSEKTTDGERVCITPDALWGSHATDVVIDRAGITYTVSHFDDSRSGGSDGSDIVTHTQTITLYPHDMLCHYSYEVRNVDNARSISKVSASISGMSESINMFDESHGTEHVTLPVSGKVDSKANNITGQFLTFGHSDSEAYPHKMTFFVVMNDGSKYRVENTDNLDVSSQVENAPDKRHVHIVIDGFKLPDSAGDDAGWTFTVDDWGTKDEELKV